MPLYDIHCPACDATHEVLLRHGEAPHCPACGSDAVQRLVSGVAPAGKSRALASAARAQARREGHLSNF